MARPALANAQTATSAAPDETLVIAGDLAQVLTIEPADLRAMPRMTVSEDGRPTSYEGVLVGELRCVEGFP